MNQFSIPDQIRFAQERAKVYQNLVLVPKNPAQLREALATARTFVSRYGRDYGPEGMLAIRAKNAAQARQEREQRKNALKDGPIKPLREGRSTRGSAWHLMPLTILTAIVNLIALIVAGELAIGQLRRSRDITALVVTTQTRPLEVVLTSIVCSLGTADVGTIENGASRVGALDMSGNVWQWVSALYKLYPYNAGDRCESATDASNYRGLRGGSWLFTTPDFLRSAIRN